MGIDIKGTPDTKYQDRLKELVPAYIITLFSLVAGILNSLLALDQIAAIFAVIIVLIFGGVVTLYIENKKEIQKNQKLLAVINGLLWLFVINMRVFTFNAVVELIISLIVTLWTFTLIYVYKG